MFTLGNKNDLRRCISWVDLNTSYDVELCVAWMLWLQQLVDQVPIGRESVGRFLIKDD